MKKQYEKYMKIAYELAQNVKGFTTPNPAVGAVIVKNHTIIGRGATGKPGKPHAEIDALKNCKKSAKNATMYVTLEPCSIYGKTPPCTKAIINAGLKKVVIGTKDPNPLIMGNGIKELNNAGVKTFSGVLIKKLIRLNEDFFKRIVTGLPFVILKFAQTIDGKIATLSGDSKWITSPKSRKYVHYLRGIYDAILVGPRTVLKDNPKLTVREHNLPNPVRIIPDAAGVTPDNAFVMKDKNQTIFIINESTPIKFIHMINNNGKLFIKLPGKGDIITLELMLNELGKREINSIFVEGGSKILSSFLESKLVDKIHAFISPKILGSGISSFNFGRPDKISQAIKLKSVNKKAFSDDVLLTGYVRTPDEYIEF